jgi:hypothetical protein
VRCREVLLWHTHHNVGNAAVMGLVPRFRYVMLSDVLIETLRDEQIVAVYAHEVGHIIHRHMVWYGVFFVALTCALLGFSDTVSTAAGRVGISQHWVDSVYPFFSILMFVACFGYVSRRFERQADVFAARTVEIMGRTPNAAEASQGLQYWVKPEQAHVGTLGAAIFNSALLRAGTAWPIRRVVARAGRLCDGMDRQPRRQLVARDDGVADALYQRDQSRPAADRAVRPLHDARAHRAGRAADRLWRVGDGCRS